MAKWSLVLVTVLAASCDGGGGGATDAAAGDGDGGVDAAAIDARPIDATVDAPVDARPIDAAVDAPPIQPCVLGPQGPPPPPPLPPPPPPLVCPQGQTRCVNGLLVCTCSGAGGLAICGGPPDPP